MNNSEKETSEESTDNKDLISAMHEEIVQDRNERALDSYFAENFVTHNKPSHLPNGPEGVKVFMRGIGQAFPDDLEVSINQLISEGDRVAVHSTITGTH